MLAITDAHFAARNAASIALADAGTAAATLQLHDAAQVLLATVTLSKPCGHIDTQGRIVLDVSATQDIAIATGAAAWCAWCDGSGTPIATGSVTATGQGGDFELVGTSGTMIYAGAVVLLSGITIG